MRNKIIKTAVLLLGASFIISACSFSFPWEKDRGVNDIVDPDLIVESSDDSLDEQREERPGINLQGELRKFSNLSSLNNFITSAKIPKTDLKNLSAENNYGFLSEINLKDLTDSSVNLNKADIVKVKGEFVYILTPNKLMVVKTGEGSLSAPVFEEELEGVALELNISGNNLVVTGYSDLETDAGGKHVSFLKIYDIAKGDSPQKLRSLHFEGHYAGLNLDYGFAYLLTVSPVELATSNKLVLPEVLSAGESLDDKCSLNRGCLLSQAYYLNNLYSNFGFLSSAAVPLADSNKPIVRQLFLLDDSYELYSSLDNNIYLAKHNSLSKLDLEREIKKELIIDDVDEIDSEAIKTIENTPSYLQSSEDKAELDKIITKYFLNLSEEQQNDYDSSLEDNLAAKVKSLSSRLDITSIYKFTWRNNRLAYLAKGLVPGILLEGGSLDEDGDTLRVATVRGELWPLLFDGSKKNYSNLYILDDNLKTINSLENISTDNLISNASFMADRVYLKTAKTDNPFYVVGLSRDDSLSVLGAVSTEAYANFYPFNPGGESLLALGKPYADEAMAEASLKLSVFDFEDIKKPAALSTYAIGDKDSDSFAILDYKAIGNSLTTKSIVLPASFKDQERLSFSGTLVFDYNTQGHLNLLHRIDHSGGGVFGEQLKWRGLNYLNSTVLRSFVLKDNIYTVSSKYLKINKLGDGAELLSVNLSPGPEDELVVSEEELSDEGADLDPLEMGEEVSMAEAALIIEKQANKFFATEDELITVSAISEDYGMYQADVSTEPTPIKVFLSKDASLFFSGIVSSVNLEDYDPSHQKYKDLSQPEAEDMALRYINHLTKEDEKSYSVADVLKRAQLYNVIAGPEDGPATAYYMTTDGHLFFSQVGLVE